MKKILPACVLIISCFSSCSHTQKIKKDDCNMTKCGCAEACGCSSSCACKCNS